MSTTPPPSWVPAEVGSPPGLYEPCASYETAAEQTLGLGEHRLGTGVDDVTIALDPRARADLVGDRVPVLPELGQRRRAGQPAGGQTGVPERTLVGRVRRDGLGAEVAVDPFGVQQVPGLERLLDGHDGGLRTRGQRVVGAPWVDLGGQDSGLHVDGGQHGGGRRRCGGAGRRQTGSRPGRRRRRQCHGRAGDQNRQVSPRSLHLVHAPSVVCPRCIANTAPRWGRRVDRLSSPLLTAALIDRHPCDDGSVNSALGKTSGMSTDGLSARRPAWSEAFRQHW